MTDTDWMRLALREARLALNEGEVPVGAVLVRGDTLLVRAHNRREALQDPTAHAELICLREGGAALGGWRLTGCTLYVTLEPCPMCAGALAESQLGSCVYGAADPAKGCCGSVYDLPADPLLRSAVTWRSGVLAEECAQLLRVFFQQRRKREDGRDSAADGE